MAKSWRARVYVPTVCIVGILAVGSTFFGASGRAILSNASSDSMTSTSLSGLPLPLSASGGSDFDTDGIPDAIELELGSNPYDLAQPDTLSALSVIWYVDNAAPAARVPPSANTTTIVYLHNNIETTRTCLIEYYTQEGTYVGPVSNRTFSIAPSSSLAFRPVADDPASVPGGQEAPQGRAVPNRPLNTDNGNDGKRNGSMVIRWIGDSNDVQGVCTTHGTAAGLGPHSLSYLLPPGLIVSAPPGPPTTNSLNVPWYVDTAGAAMRIPPSDGLVTSLVYLHNNTSEPMECAIEYYTQEGVYIGPLAPIDQVFTIPANVSIAFRPVQDDPASVWGGQESAAGRAVPNRPSGTENGNDGKRNGSIVIRWTGTPTDVQGFCATYGNTNDLAPLTTENPSGQAPHTFAYLLPPGLSANDLSGPAASNALNVPWYVDTAAPGQRIPPRDNQTTSIIFLHNNRDVAMSCEIEYYTQNGVYVGPFGATEKQFSIPANASVAFRPVADDPATVPGGQEATAGLAVPNRPINTENGNDGKRNGSIVVRWMGRSGDIQGVATTYLNTAGLGPSTLGYLLPRGFTTPLDGAAPNSLSVPWYVDTAFPAQRIPPRDGKVSSLIYLHNNEPADLECGIEYYTQDGVFIGPPAGANSFTIPADASLAFRPGWDDPATVFGGQESAVGMAVPNRPRGTEGGNDGKLNGSIVIRWNGSPASVQGMAATHGSPAGMQPVTPENPSGLATYAFSYLLPDGGALAGEGEGEGEGELPPDPATVAPPMDPTEATDIADATEFLYTGYPPIQTGVAPGTIEARRVAVLRGTVRDSAGAPVPGVAITIFGHPEFGSTLTREDGAFDMAVNGGGPVVIDYAKAGYLPARRTVDVPWRDYVQAPDVVLIALDPVATVIDFSEPMEVAQGSEVSDADGTRQATLLFPQGTKARMLLKSGHKSTLNQLTVRATEYSTGESGPEAMPAELPPNSGYTYCVEFTADEALKSGAVSVEFNPPVVGYVQNWLYADIGDTVPLGYYDRQMGTWRASDSGRVVEILAEEAGAAVLDIDGSGVAATPEVLDALGVTTAELQRLASLYEPGDSLWRMPIPHFSPWDANWPFGPPLDATFPSGTPEPDIPMDFPCEGGLSIVEFQNQVLGEEVDVHGTGMKLHYRSDRVHGNRAAYALRIPLSGTQVPASLVGILCEITVAGRTFNYELEMDQPCLSQPPLLAAAPPKVARYAPKVPPEPSRDDKDLVTDLTNQSYTFVWDGFDAYGRALQGRQPVNVRIGYRYCGQYQKTDKFGYNGGGNIEGSSTREDVILWTKWDGGIGPWDSRAIGLGAWSLSGHHAYDPVGRMLYLGNGRRVSASGLVPIITTVAGAPEDGFQGDGGPATQARLYNPIGLAVGPDGTLYIADQFNQRVRRVTPDGIISTVAGFGWAPYNGDGIPATEASLRYPSAVALGQDGSIYISEANRVRRVAPNGIISTVTGNGEICMHPDPWLCGDGGPATEATVESAGLAVGPDGSLYIADGGYRIRRVDPNGIISTITGISLYYGFDENMPIGQAHLYMPAWLTCGRDGTLLIGERIGAVLRVAPDGWLTRVAGTYQPYYMGPDGVPATSSDCLEIAGVGFMSDDGFVFGERSIRVRRVGRDGIINTIAGGRQGFGGDGGPAKSAELYRVEGLAVGPGDSVYVSDWNRVRRIGLPLASYSSTDIVIHAPDLDEVYVFNSRGKHIETRHALTGATLYTFQYDSDGLLASLTDAGGNATTIERDTNGNATAIIAPFGQRTDLTVNAEGYLADITNPAAESVHATYSLDGLLTSFTDGFGGIHTFGYDDYGRLISDVDSTGAETTLARAESPDSRTVTVTTPEGLVHTYETERLLTGAIRHTNSTCCGNDTVATVGTDGGYAISFPDGTTMNVGFGPDPLWGMQTSRVAAQTITTPLGRTLRFATTRQAQLEFPEDLFSIATAQDVVTINDRPYTRTYTGATRTFVETSPAGRQVTTVLDSVGRITQEQIAGLHPSQFSHGPNGDLTAISFGSGPDARSVTLGYNAAGDLVTVTNPLGGVRTYGCDANGRVLQETLEDGATVMYTYDPNGNVSSITPPGRPAHTFTYTPVDLLASYTPPGGPATYYTYDLDRRQVRTTRADGSVIDFNFDGEGQLATILLPTGTMTYGYDAQGRFSSLGTPEGLGLSYTYDGFLLTSQTWSGPVVGAVQYGYDNDFRVISVSVNGAPSYNIQYDADGYMTQCGDLTLARDAQNGLVTQAVLGGITESWTYDGFGKPVICSASFGGSTLYACEYTYDGQGRVIEKVESIAAESHDFAYMYDPRSRLIAVDKDGTDYATYNYELNDNRLVYTGPGGPLNGTYDDRDWLVQYGTATYQYAPTGELVSMTDGPDTTVYTYDALGFLKGVTLPDATHIDYILDGHGRRIGRKVNDVLLQAWLYEDDLRPAAELDGAGTVVSRFIYAEGVNVPAYMVKGGLTYRLITDVLGSPRLVVDTATGVIAQRIDYDEFGNVTQDTAPGFQPFGFAGGLYDPATGLTHFGARDYDAHTGRWMSRDPILFDAGQTNLYAYVNNDPVNFSDPTGTCDLVCIGIKGAYRLWKDPRTGVILKEAIKATVKKVVETAEEKAARFAKANAQRALQAEANKAMLQRAAGSSGGGKAVLFYVGIRPSFLCTVMRGNAPFCPKPPRWSREAQMAQDL